jgi:O-antigen/teichoic acid export membrane protein
VLVEFIIVILSFLVFRLANENMDEVGFSEYNLARRGIALFQPLLMLGLGVAVPRYISIYIHRNSLLPAAIGLLLFAAVLMGVVFLSWKAFFAELLFGGSNYQDYIFPLFLLIFGYCYHAVLFGFLRGKLSYMLSNFMQLIHIGAWPVLSVIFYKNVLNLLYFNSIALLITCALFTGIIFYKYHLETTVKKLIFDIGTLTKYGLPRVLGDFALLVMLTAPTFIILNIKDDMLISGDIAYSLTLLNFIGAAFSPFGIILLPEIGIFLRDKKFTAIKRRFRIFFISALVLNLIGFIIYYSFTAEILKLLLGKQYRESIIHISQLILLSSFGYTAYIVLRNFLDALKVRALNSINLVLTLIIYFLLICFCFYIDAEISYYLIAFALVLSMLGLLTFVQTYKAVKELNSNSNQV